MGAYDIKVASMVVTKIIISLQTFRFAPEGGSEPLRIPSIQNTNR